MKHQEVTAMHKAQEQNFKKRGERKESVQCKGTGFTDQVFYCVRPKRIDKERERERDLGSQKRSWIEKILLT